MTLLSLSLVVGILVDDAIVEIENIVRHLRMGKTPYQAAMEAADEIGLAVIATTFTLIAVFLPTAFMSGVPGKFFVQFGWTAAIAVFFSLVVARMLTPMMAAYLLKRADEAARGEPAGSTIYMRWARVVPAAPLSRRSLARGASSSARSSLVAAAADRLHPARRPVADAGHAHAAAGQHACAQTLRHGRAGARSIVQQNPHVKLVYTAVGGGSAGADPFDRASARAEVRKATLTINLTPRGERRGSASRRSRASCARRSRRCPARASRSASAARARSTSWCWPARTADVLRAARAQRRARAAHASPASATSPRPRAWSGPSSSCGPTSRAPPTSASPSAAIAETLRIATAGDYDQGLRQAQPGAAPGADRRQARPTRRARTSTLLERLPVPGARGPVLLGNVADADDRQRPGARSTATTACATSTSRSSSTAQPLGDVETRGACAAEPAATCRPA